MRFSVLPPLLFAVLLAACPLPWLEPDPEVSWPHLECDPIDPSVCGFPFPNNVFTVADAAAATGRRVALADRLLPVSDEGARSDPARWNVADGFSSGTPLLTFLPGATEVGLPRPDSIGRSLDDDSPTIVLDADTGERVPHFAELDYATSVDEARTFIIRPVIPLAPARRYIVAIRGVVDGAGALVLASPAFTALRDETASDEAGVEERRGLYADIFARLEAQGWARAEVQRAWDFTTGSIENSTGRLLSMRDQTFAHLDDAGVSYTIESVDEEWTDHIGKRVTGTLTVPLFVDATTPGATLNLDGVSLPVASGTAEIPFTLLVPRAAQTAPARVAMVGHGLLASQAQVESSYYQRFAEGHGFALAAVDWQGMSQADSPTIVSLILSGEFERFATVPDRLQQALVNFMVLRRVLEGPLRDDPALQGPTAPLLSSEPVTYFGSSQGGILGAVLLAVDPDLQRGVLDVAGQPYSLMLTRSNDFDLFLGMMKQVWEDPRDIQLIIALAQQLWDRAEPTGYSRHLAGDPLPGVGAKEALLTLAIGDHQVPTMSGHVMARAMGLPVVGPPNREPWGLDVVDEADAQGGGLVEYDFGLPLEPLASVPMDEGPDPHPTLRTLEHYMHLRATFLTTGQVQTLCDGPCSPD